MSFNHSRAGIRKPDVLALNVRELYRQLKPYMEICPDAEVMVATGRRQFYPVGIDRSDFGDRSIVVTCITPATDDFQSRRKQSQEN